VCVYVCVRVRECVCVCVCACELTFVTVITLCKKKSVKQTQQKHAQLAHAVQGLCV